MPIDVPTLALIHVVLSLLGMLSGLVVVGGLMAGVLLGGWTGLFLATLLLTNLSGFAFPFVALQASHVAAALSVVLLLGAALALYAKRLGGGWRRAFVVLGVAALYLDLFVLLLQLFHKFRVLVVAAPEATAPAAIGTHLVVLVLFIGLGRAAARSFGRAGFGARRMQTSGDSGAAW